MYAVMIDIETLGTHPGAIVLSVGITGFNRGMKEVYETEYIELDTGEQYNLGMTADPRTVAWWMSQGEVAKRVFEEGKKTPVSELIAYMNELGWENVEVWCNGTSFDFPILRELFKRFGHEAPWKYWMERDMRTVKALAGDTHWAKHKVEALVPHHAGEDSRSQAQTLVAVLREA